MNLTCQHCGTEYRVKPSEATSSRFCSKHCRKSAPPKWGRLAVFLHLWSNCAPGFIARIVGSNKNSVRDWLKKQGVHDPKRGEEWRVFHKIGSKPRIAKEKKPKLTEDEYRRRSRARSMSRYYTKLRGEPQRAIDARKALDPQHRIKKALRLRVWKKITEYGGTKSMGTMELVGCTIDELKAHIEKQFQPGMTWENYGRWHIDHIKPCAAFDLTIRQQQIDCFNYNNLQPLWAFDNHSKHASGYGRRRGRHCTSKESFKITTQTKGRVEAVERIAAVEFKKSHISRVSE